MNIEQMKRFVAVCENSSISKAAQQLFISKQGLSSSIHSLEEEIHQTLLVRTLNGISLTPAGMAVYRYAKQTIEAYNNMLVELAGTEEKKDWIRMAFSHGFFACAPIDIVFSFIAKHPDLRFEQSCAHTYEIQELFSEQKLDIALCSGPKDEARFDYYVLFRNQRCLYVSKSHPLARYNVVYWEDLKDIMIGVPGERYNDTKFLRENCSAHGFEPNLFICEGLDMMYQFARTGAGASLIVDNLDKNSIPSDLKTVYFKDRAAAEYDVYVMTKKNNSDPIVREFVDHAIRYCKNLV